MNKIKNFFDVVAYQLCCGCGVCAYIYPKQIKMIDAPLFGRRPLFIEEYCNTENKFSKAIEACPGIGLAHDSNIYNKAGLDQFIGRNWGPIYEFWEGHSADREIRFKGSSGGVMSALALYCLEQKDMYGCLHITSDSMEPHLNMTTLSNSRESIMAATGSRYSPASPCEKLREIENAPSPCVFMGKPCDVAAVSKLSKQKPIFNEKIGLSIACFCAGTPSTSATVNMLKQMGILKIEQLLSLRYRGCGWPGKTVAKHKNNKENIICKELTYREAWGDILQKYRQWRCYICPDHTGEFADIAVGDPWYKRVAGDDNGRSLILVRSVRGKNMLQGAIAKGYLIAEKKDHKILVASQPGLLKTRARLWGQLIALKILDAPYPSYKNFNLLSSWLKNLTLSEKINSILGTIKRAYTKKLKKKQEMLEN